MSLFLGFDVSTQQIKVIATDEKLKAQKTYSVEFDQYYKDQYGIHKGVIAEGSTIVSPVSMWLEAIDRILGEMCEDGFPMERVRGISGSCQQHGSVFWSDPDRLEQLDPEYGLADQLRPALAYEYSPNWQDHSTGAEGDAFEEAMGGAAGLARATGSRAHFRFTGLQIRKLARKQPSVYKRTARISLVSSFVESVLLGKISTLEEADACGMNLYDVLRGDWDASLLAVAAGAHPKIDGTSQTDADTASTDLRNKLGPVSPVSYKSAGTISPYFKKYNLPDSCKIYKFTGDNLATIISLPLTPKDCLISLGTSTTVLVVTDKYEPSPQYHLFKHPTMPNHYMGMICYCNGALAREKVRDELNSCEKEGSQNGNSDHDTKPGSWDRFNSILDKSPGYSGKIGVYFPLGEIVPSVPAQTRRFSNGKEAHWSVEDDVVAIVESQALSCRLRAGPMLADKKDVSPELRQMYDEMTRDGQIVTDGVQQNLHSVTSRPHKCYYVGGASNNPSIVAKMGSIIGPEAGNYKVEIANACALGGAFKASWGYLCETKGDWVDYGAYIESLFDPKDMEKVDVPDMWEDYFRGLGDLANLEKRLEK